MATQPTITEAAIRSVASSQSYDKGEDYYRSGAVGEIQRRGDTLIAEVEGSSYEPYQVTIELGEGGIVSADCTCPYDWGGYCKHIVAVLLTYLRDQDEVEERPTADALLAGLDAEMLRRLLVDLLARHPDLMDWVEAQLAIRRPEPAQAAALQTAGEPPRTRRTPVDDKVIRRQVRGQMRSSGDYYEASGVVSGLDEILGQARQALTVGDGENALVIAEVIAEETLPGWEEFDDSDGEFGDWFSDLGAVFTEALLTADLSPAERKAWAGKLGKWQAELDDYGVDEAFDGAIAAAEQGWDYEPLRRAMAGHITDEGAWDDEAPWYADALTTARLNVLERQGRITEYLNLAEAEGQTERYVTMLVKAGRAQEAVDYGLEYLGTPGEALALAKALREHGDTRAALRIGEHGLGFEGDQLVDLARWLREAAAAMDDAALTLRAARAAFDASLSLADYQAVRAMAGDRWPELQPELLARLAAASHAYERTDIYLSEGMVDEAIQAIDAAPYTGHMEVAKVVDAAWRTHPDWAIRQCRRQAEPIMDEGKSKYYSSALSWLEKARNAYTAAGRADEWRAYCEGLITKHGRKYSLVPGLKELLKTPRSK